MNADKEVAETARSIRRAFVHFDDTLTDVFNPGPDTVQRQVRNYGKRDENAPSQDERSAYSPFARDMSPALDSGAAALFFGRRVPRPLFLADDPCRRSWEAGPKQGWSWCEDAREIALVLSGGRWCSTLG